MFLRPEGLRTVGERIAGIIEYSKFSVRALSLARTENQTTASTANGAFSEYLVTDAEPGVVPIPDGWSFKEAAQLGVPPFTALQALHQSLEFPSPFETSSTANPHHTVLIWGGASAVGQYAQSWADFAS